MSSVFFIIERLYSCWNRSVGGHRCKCQDTRAVSSAPSEDSGWQGNSQGKAISCPLPACAGALLLWYKGFSCYFSFLMFQFNGSHADAEQLRDLLGAVEFLPLVQPDGGSDRTVKECFFFLIIVFAIVNSSVLRIVRLSSCTYVAFAAMSCCILCCGTLMPGYKCGTKIIKNCLRSYSNCSSCSPLKSGDFRAWFSAFL